MSACLHVWRIVFCLSRNDSYPLQPACVGSGDAKGRLRLIWDVHGGWLWC
jgi:hypothetical protein